MLACDFVCEGRQVNAGSGQRSAETRRGHTPPAPAGPSAPRVSGACPPARGLSTFLPISDLPPVTAAHTLPPAATGKFQAFPKAKRRTDRSSYALPNPGCGQHCALGRLYWVSPTKVSRVVPSPHFPRRPCGFFIVPFCTAWWFLTFISHDSKTHCEALQPGVWQSISLEKCDPNAMTIIIDHPAQTGVSTTCQALCWAPGPRDNGSSSSEAVTSRYCGVVSSLR